MVAAVEDAHLVRYVVEKGLEEDAAASWRSLGVPRTSLFILPSFVRFGGSSYHSTENKFERFRGFFEFISRFEFEFCRRGNYIYIYFFF